MITDVPKTPASADLLIKAKIDPPLTDGWVERARPEGLLAEALERRRVVVVSATAGAGKTTLVAAVTERLDRPVAWLTVDSGDVAPGRLLTYLQAAVAAALPRTAGVVDDALAARIPHPDAAALLADATAGEHLVLVLDELERLGDAPEPWAVLEGMLRHAPADLRCVLCSRRAVPASVLPRNPGAVARLGDDALALTVDEAGALLARSARPEADAAAAVAATGGWMTGVLFEAWRSGPESGDGDDPLFDYLGAQILDGLPQEDRDFLIATSVLHEVTADRAAALGRRDGGCRLASLHRAHLPASWGDGGRTLRCHPRFREYLQSCLDAWEGERRYKLLVAHGRLLATEGRDEDATEVLLQAGARTEALDPASRAIFDVINRLDFALARRWLDTLADVEPPGMSPLLLARLTLAVASEDHRSGVELADRLVARGLLAEVAGSSSLAAWMVGVCYIMVGRYDEGLGIFALAPQDADYDTLRSFMAIFGTDAPPPPPAPTGGWLDSLVLPTVYGYGRLHAVLEVHGATGWVQAHARPWMIDALADAGRLREAIDLLTEVRTRGRPTAVVEAVVAPHVLTDAGRRDEALEALGRGRRLARHGPSHLWELLADVEEARLHLRLDGDPVAALAALGAADRDPITHRSGLLGPIVDLWYGFALLLEDRDGEAVTRLRRAVELFRRTDRWLEMPAAAVYLAEAEWRAGDEDAADEAADLALEAARAQGFNNTLLMALRDFPAVLSRRLDAEPRADSPWHELGRALRAQGLHISAPARATVRLVEFGRCAVVVDGTEVHPRLSKAYDLLAYLLTRPHHVAQRDELLEVLFDARADDSSRSYLRQAIRWLRAVLPPDGVVTEGAAVGISTELAALSESVEFEHAIAEAARMRGPDRLTATLTALAVVDRGPYLPGSGARWGDERRELLRELATDARYEAAELAFVAGRLEQAEQLTETVLGAEPFHEPAWRLAMRLAGARGDDQAVLRSFQRCDRVLAEVGAEPSATTRQLVNQLRR